MFYKIWRKILGLPTVTPDNFPHIHDAIEFINSDSCLKNFHWQGTTADYLALVETKIGTELPAAFKDYCRLFGNRDDQMFGRDSAFDLLKTILYCEEDKEYGWSLEPDERAEVNAFFERLDRLYPEYKNIPAFCFSSHEGHAYYWFYLTGEDDPDCFTFMEPNTFEKHGPFSKFLVERLTAYSELMRRLGRKYY